MFKTIGKILTESLQDNATGKYSSARVIAMLVAIAATVFMWKLVLLGGMTIDYFIAYLAYGTGSVSLNKFLDNRDGARSEQARSMLPQQLEDRQAERDDDRRENRHNDNDDDRDPSLRPPRED